METPQSMGDNSDPFSIPKVITVKKKKKNDKEALNNSFPFQVKKKQTRLVKWNLILEQYLEQFTKCSRKSYFMNGFWYFGFKMWRYSYLFIHDLHVMKF